MKKPVYTLDEKLLLHSYAVLFHVLCFCYDVTSAHTDIDDYTFCFVDFADSFLLKK